MKNIDTLINDLKKALAVEEKLSEISLTKIKSPVDELLEYAFSYSIIKSASDLLTVCKAVPELENKLTTMFDNKINSKKDNSSSYSSPTYYKRLQDAPGYGTYWNERCVPDDICLSGCYSSSSRC